MYYLSTEFLFESNSVTSLRIQYGDYISVEVDNNLRQLIITAPKISRYSILKSIPGFSVFNEDEFIREVNTYLRSDSVILGGIRYFFFQNVTLFTQIITSEVPTGVEIINDMLYISINPNSEIDTLAKYLNLINSSGKAWVRVGGGEFGIYNYLALDIDNPKLPSSLNNDVLSYQEINITGTDIVLGFVNFLKSEFPSVEIRPELDDLTNLEDKTEGYIFYKSGIPVPSGQLTTHLLYTIEMGRFMYSEIRMEMEYLTDDLIHYEHFRNKHMLEMDTFHKTKFQMFDSENLPWNCNIVWDYDFNSEMDKSPMTRNIEDSNLYSYKFNCNLYGYVVEKYTPHEIINEIITTIKNGLNNIVVVNTPKSSV